MMTTTTTTNQLSPEYIHRAAWKAGVMAAINVAVVVVAVRMIVLVAVAGGIALTWLSLRVADPLHLVALGIYCVFVVVPAVWLASRK